MIILSIFFGLIIGLILGIFGGGGALITIPILSYFLNFSFKESIAISLFLTMIGSLPALLLYLKNNELNLFAAFKLGTGGLIGSYISSIFSKSSDSKILFFILIMLMLISSYFMIVEKEFSFKESKPSSLQIYFIGFFIGILTGLVGVGGGFMLIPALMLLCKLEPRKAISTSLAVIFSNSLFAFLGHRTSIDFNNSHLVNVIIWTVFGSILGFFLSHKTNQKILKKGFGYFLILLAILMLLNPII